DGMGYCASDRCVLCGAAGGDMDCFAGGAQSSFHAAHERHGSSAETDRDHLHRRGGGICRAAVYGVAGAPLVSTAVLAGAAMGFSACALGGVPDDWLCARVGAGAV